MKDEGGTTNAQVTVQAKKFILMDRVWQDMNITATQKSGILQMRMSSPQVNGQIQYSGASQSNPNGSLTGTFSRLRAPDPFPNQHRPALVALQIKRSLALTQFRVLASRLMI